MQAVQGPRPLWHSKPPQDSGHTETPGLSEQVAEGVADIAGLAWRIIWEVRRVVVGLDVLSASARLETGSKQALKLARIRVETSPDTNDTGTRELLNFLGLGRCSHGVDRSPCTLKPFIGDYGAYLEAIGVPEA